MKLFLTGLIVALIVGAVLGYVGTGDFEEAQRQEADYCERVRTNVHTDYKKLCPNDVPKEIVK